MATKKKKKAVKKAIKKTVKKAVKKVLKKKTAPKNKKEVAPKKAKPVKKLKPVAIKKVQKAPPPDYGKAVTPLGDRLVVRVVSGKEKVTAGGIIIPDTVGTVAVGYLKAEVLAVGHGGKNKKGYVKPLDVRVGDTVLFAEYAGTKVTFNSEELQIIHESDVMGIVQN